VAAISNLEEYVSETPPLRSYSVKFPKQRGEAAMGYLLSM